MSVYTTLMMEYPMIYWGQVPQQFISLSFFMFQDLHRTGCTGFSGQDNEQDRAVLKRVLLAYARWNKQVGYCQGFNVIAALLLDVMGRKEDDALKVGLANEIG